MPAKHQFHSVRGKLLRNVRSDTFIPVREQSFALFRQSNLTAESAINSGKLATNITATNNEKMGRRMNPV